MNSRHHDGTLCVGGGYTPPLFDSLNVCPLCARDSADWATEQAAVSLRTISRLFDCEKAGALADELKKIHREISRLTWAKKNE